MNHQTFNYRYSGGSLNARDPTYITRQADRDFYHGLQAGEFCYVLNSRQMGKSSLRVRTMAKLEKEGVICTFIDLTGIGTEGVTPEQWYAGIVRDLAISCLSPRQFNWREWWRQQRDLLSPAQRLKVFIEEILLVEITAKIVIFVDEIDRVLSQDFSLDDFFAVIRGCYHLRGHKPAYKRLTWALLGVATPSDLISNPQATPFNIGRAIALDGFKLAESLVLASGLKHVTDYPEKLLQEILVWTGGQPFLTQKLCWLVANTATVIPAKKEEEWLTQLIQSKLIKNWESQDEPPHLKTIRTRLLYSPKSSKKLLLLYQQILKRGKITVRKAAEYRELQLSGLVVKEGKYLKVYNPIYESVFNRHWIQQQLVVLDDSPTIALRFVFLTSMLITLLIMSIRSLALLQTWELAAFDLLMRHRPLEPPDSRILIVGATEQDLNTYGYPLPDAVLARLLDKLQQSQPKAIGLDIVRDNPVPQANVAGHQALNRHFKHNKKLISVCTFDRSLADTISPPSASPTTQLGFVDLLHDQPGFISRNKVIRRHLLSHGDVYPSQICQSPYSFAWQLIYLYLEDKGITISTVEDNWQFGSLLTKRLQKHSGGYHNLDAQGSQILINYRHTTHAQQFAPQVSISELLNPKHDFDYGQIKDRVILIGVTATSVQDLKDTPYGEMRGLCVHAHAVSQILSAVEDNRPLIWWLPFWGDTGWIWLWSFAGGIVIWCCRKPIARSTVTVILLVSLSGCCWLFFIQGGWLPLIPSVLGLLSAEVSLVVLAHKQLNYLIN